MPTAAEYLARLRGRLLLDWDDPFLRGTLFVSETGAPRKKLTDLVSARSEDAITWSVFRTLLRLSPESWLTGLLACCAARPSGAVAPLEMEFWRQVPPPASRLLWLLDNLDKLSFHDPRRLEQAQQRLERVRQSKEHWKTLVVAGPPERGDGILEGSTEPDVVVDTPGAVVVVEAKYLSDISPRTTWDPRRDTLGRCLDAALELAGPHRQPYFVLVTDDYVHEGPYVVPMTYETLVPRYRDDPAFRAAQLPHRSDEELARLEGCIGWTTWADLMDTVLDNSADFPVEHKSLLRELVEYLKERKLLHKGG